jgi:hypothetical protein
MTRLLAGAMTFGQPVGERRAAERQRVGDDCRRPEAQPSIDPDAFPATPTDFFWTSTTVMSFVIDAWSVSFLDGHVDMYADKRVPSALVRCVRSEPQPPDGNAHAVSDEGRRMPPRFR